MENVQFIDFLQDGQYVTHAVIHNNDGSMTSMLKSTYDEMIAAQSTPIDTEDE
jgi:hypothetical protein